MRGEWSPEVGRGESKHPSLPLARAERKPLDRKKNLPCATSARTCSKKKPALSLARAERKPLEQKIKTAPRHQRENLLKENQAQLQESFAPRHRRERQQYTFLIHAIFENCDKLL